MLKTSFIVLMILVLALPAVAATTGDPLDTNDGPAVSTTNSLEYPACDQAEKWPACVPCWTTCVYQIMASAWTDGGWDNGDF